MTHPIATVIIPTHDHASTVGIAARSALNQTVPEVEVVVVGDGVRDDTRDAMSDLRSDDERLRFLDLPKGPNHGELYRGDVVDSSRAEIVCYLCDDDLLLDDHVEAMAGLLADADFAQSLNGFIDPSGRWHPYIGDLSSPECRAWLFGPGHNFVSITGMAHTVASYRRLPFGWRTTPAGEWPDHHMAQQFLAEPWVRAATAPRVTALQFPSSMDDRQLWDQAARLAELEAWNERLADRKERDRFDVAVRQAMVSAAASYRMEADSMAARVRELSESIRYLESRDAGTRPPTWWP